MRSGVDGRKAPRCPEFVGAYDAADRSEPRAGGIGFAGPGIGALGNAATDGPPVVLGRFSARHIDPVKASERHTVVGWRLAQDGRKMTAGSALFTAAGQAAGVARATWIRLG